VRRRGPLLLLLALALAGAAGKGAARLAAQNPPQRPPPAPTPQADTARAGQAQGPDTSRAAGQAPAAPKDTVPVPDSLSPDSFRPQLPPLGAPPGPLPKSGRTVFDRDALWFSGALTLGELLERVPGAMLVRAGWYGRPEVIHYAGQGATSVVLVLDGFALDPVGRDSTGLDLSQVNLGLLRRVEVEVLPSQLRVYLFTDDQAVRRARTETSFATGDAGTSSYLIRYLNRWKNGTGLGLGVNYLATNGAPASPGRSSELGLWAKGSWVPAPRFGVAYQVLSRSVDRDSFGLLGLAGPITPPSGKARRTDAFFRGFVASRADGMGLRFDGLVGSTSYRDTSAALDRDQLQAAAIASYRAGHWSSELTARVRDNPTPMELQLRAAASPFAPLTVAGYLLRRSHLAGRRSQEGAVEAELRPWPALTVHAAARSRDEVAAPAYLTDGAQRVTDVSAGVSLTTRPVDLDLSFARHGAYAPPVYGTFGDIVPGYPDLGVRTATVTFAVRPTAYFTVSGWYRHPLDRVTSAYEPPHHSRIWATFRSRLLPVLRRGAFDFVAEGGLEGWSHGALGVDSTGGRVELKGATVLDWRLELRLLGAALFWTFRNADVERYYVVPGVFMPRVMQRYGVRWEFTN
jgi:hypothetical protein